MSVVLKLKYVLLLFVLVLSGACVKNDEFNIPDSCKAANLAANTTYEQVKSLLQDKPVLINEDLIIEGIVISSDKAGNFFGTLHFQNKVVNPTEGFQIEIDLRDYHLQYEVGDKVFIKLKGLYLGRSQETYKIGGLFLNAGGTLSVGRLPYTKVKQHLIKSCESPAEVIPLEIGLNELSNDLINTLVKLNNMQVSPVDMCQNYAPEATYIDRILEDCSGIKINLANSGYADFQSQILPTGNGSITGILGYDSGKYNLIIRDLSDMTFNNPRCNGTTFSCDPPLPTVSIAELKDYYQGEPLLIDENLVIKGFITATDDSGNFLKELYLQDSTSGIKVNINSTRLFDEGFEKNKGLIINCEGLTLDKVQGELQLGVWEEGAFEPINIEETYRNIYLLEESTQIEPFKMDISTIKPIDVGKLIQLEAIQFSYPSFTFVEDNNHTAHVLNDCNGNLLPLKTLKTASFKDNQLPQEKGIITAILSHNGDNFVLRLRDQNDLLDFTSSRCDLFETATTVSINTLKSRFQGVPLHITDNIKIIATVISNSNDGNFGEQEVVVQDAESGMQVFFNAPHNLTVNTQVEIAVWNAWLNSENGNFRIENLDNSHIINTVDVTPPTPVSLNMTDVGNPEFQNMLVSFNEIQFIDPDVFREDNYITDCEENLLLKVRPEAVFYNMPHPTAKGNVKGILGYDNTFVLRIGSTTDFEETGSSILCYINDSDEVFISELADPDNNADARFVELFNAGETDVLLDGWKLLRYTNNNVDISSEIDLSGIKIRSGQTLIISPNATVFEQVYGFPPDLSVGANSPADSNGDDNLVLLNAQGEIADIFGVVGEDGSGTNHEFEDGRAHRKPEVVKGSTSYVFDQWVIYNDTGGNGTTNLPQNAPEDFTPGQR